LVKENYQKNFLVKNFYFLVKKRLPKIFLVKNFYFLVKKRLPKIFLVKLIMINCNLNGHSLRDGLNIIFLVKKRQNTIEIYQSITGPCPNCKVLINTLIAFKNNPNFIIAKPAINLNVLRFNYLPKEQTIDGHRRYFTLLKWRI
jgi:hypothetical protein